jgi:hypothetical protein
MFGILGQHPAHEVANHRRQALIAGQRAVAAKFQLAAQNRAVIMPIAVRAVLEALSIARAARLRSERARLVEAWGLEAPPQDQ